MAKVLFPLKWKKKLAQHILQIQFVLELADKLKPDYLLKISVFWLCTSELIILIISAKELVLTLGHGTILKEEYHLDNPTLRFRCSEESNIQELKARPFLKKLISNINNSSADLFPKQRGLPKKKNVQQLPYKVILDLDI